MKRTLDPWGWGGGYSALNLPGCVSKVSGHVSTQNGSQICPSTPFGGFLWTVSTRYGSLPIPFSGLCTQYHTID